MTTSPTSDEQNSTPRSDAPESTPNADAPAAELVATDATTEPGTSETVELVDPAAGPVPTNVDAVPADVDTVPADVDAVPASAPAPEVVAVAAVAPSAPTVVFVTAPEPPKKRGARGVGALVALLGTALFAATYAVLVLLIALIGSPNGLVPALQYLSSVTFYLPVIVFFLAYLLLNVIVNRAGWSAHVLGGFVVAVVVWVGFVGSAIIAAGALGASAATVGTIVLQQLTNPLGFAAAIAAREVPIWVGGIVARRGRTARARNADQRVAYEQKLADHRATLAANTAV